jgi:hypothetical protein
VVTPLPPDTADTDADPRVAATIRLLHRRRGWAWTTVASLVLFLVAAGVTGALNPGPAPRGAGVAVGTGFILVLAVLTVVGLVAVVADTVRLHRAHPEVREQARQQTSHHPVIAHPHRYPPRHRVSWVLGWLSMLMWLLYAIYFLPKLVDGIGYVAGVGGTATFTPTSYGQSCGRSCTTITNGTLDIGGGVSATWPDRAALDQPFQVRVPVWNAWGPPWELIDGPAAAGDIVGGVLSDGIGVFVLFCVGAVALERRVWMRRQLPSRRSAGAPGL